MDTKVDSLRDVRVEAGGWVNWYRGEGSLSAGGLVRRPYRRSLGGPIEGAIVGNKIIPYDLMQLLVDNSGGRYWSGRSEAEERILDKTPRQLDDNPKTAVGLTKPSMSCIPPSALLAMSAAFTDGEEKYGPMNWRKDAVSSTVYYDAAMRHLLAWFDGEDRAEDSTHHHLAHALTNIAILIDAQSVGKLNDNRPLPGKAAEIIKGMTKSING